MRVCSSRFRSGWLVCGGSFRRRRRTWPFGTRARRVRRRAPEWKPNAERNELRGRGGPPWRHHGVEAGGLRPAKRGGGTALGIAGPKVALDLPLDPLERVVDRLHLTLQEGGDLVVALAVRVEPQHLRLEL